MIHKISEGLARMLCRGCGLYTLGSNEGGTTYQLLNTTLMLSHEHDGSHWHWYLHLDEEVPAEAREFTIHDIRDVCARELCMPRDYAFFNADYEDGETPDDALWRLFLAEKEAQAKAEVFVSDEDVVLTLCHG